MTSSISQDHVLQEVKNTAQIVEVIGECLTLKRSGANLKGLCPFHAEKTPSFMVNPDRQTFHCFGCGEGGDAITFMMKYHRMTFPEALKELARRYHIALPEKKLSSTDLAMAKKRQRLFEINDHAATLYHDFLCTSPCGATARAYLEERGINEPLITSFRLGYAPDSWDFLGKKLATAKIADDDAADAGLLVRKERGGFYDRFRDRVMFPILDLTGRVAGFGGRILGDGQPKYLNTPETPVFDKGRILFGLYQHKDQIRRAKRALLVEGNFDLLSLAVHGVEYAAAPLGTALSNAHVRTLKGYADEVILLFDGDAAGIKAAMRAVSVFLAEGVSARVAVLPTEHDPDTYIRAHGRAGLEALLDTAQPLPEFVFDCLVEEHGMSLDGKVKILKELQPIINAASNNPLQHSVFVSHFSDRLGLDTTRVLDGFRADDRRDSRRGRQRTPSTSAPAATTLTLPRQQRQLLGFIILNPALLDRLLEAGLETVLDNPMAIAILSHLKALCRDNNKQPVAPEELLNKLPDGPERQFVSQLLIAAPTCPLDERETRLAAEAEEFIAWLNRDRLLRDKEKLNREIEQALRDNDMETVLRLSKRKTEINAALPDHQEDVQS